MCLNMDSKISICALLIGSCLILSSCAELGYKKGLAISSEKSGPRGPSHFNLITISQNPPIAVKIRPYENYRAIMVGLCPSIPLPFLPWIPDIITTIKKRKDYEIPDEKLVVTADFSPIFIRHYVKNLKTNAHYSYKPSDAKLIVGDRIFAPANIKCTQWSESGPMAVSRTIPDPICHRTSDDHYAFFMSSVTFTNVPTFTMTFDISARDIQNAQLDLGNLQREEAIMPIPKIKITRKKTFDLDCAI